MMLRSVCAGLLLLAETVSAQRVTANHFARAESGAVASLVPPSALVVTSPTVVACDPNALTAASNRKLIGGAIGGLGAVVTFFAFYDQTETTYTFGVPQVQQSVNMPRLVIGLGALGYGAYQWMKSDRALVRARDQALRSLSIGSTSQADATSCLGRPDAVSTTRSTAGEQTILSYATKADGVRQFYRLTFARDVLTNVERASSK